MSLLGWLAEPDDRHGIHVLGSADEWSWYPYSRLAGMVVEMAERLADAGIGRDDVVAVATGTGPEFVASFFGALVLGATPAPLAPPGVFTDPARYRAEVARYLAVSRATAVVPPTGGEPAAAPGIRLVSAADLAGRREVAGREVTAGDRALMQFTSGSTGPARGVVIPRTTLETAVEAIRGWLRMDRADATATWLPVHHDMGLVGCLLTPIVVGGTLWLMQPERFLRKPGRWLDCFGRQGAALTAVPAFALDHVVRRTRPEELAGSDFSRWRAVIVGAERIDPGAVRRFTSFLRPYGFAPRAVLPAYGLAEATLAVTGVALDDEPRTVAVDPRTLVVGERITVVPPGADPEPAVLSLTGCGTPVAAGTTVHILGADGGELGDGRPGEIAVAGPVVAAERVDSDGRAVPVPPGRPVRTGDCGFLLDGELFVVGRMGDSLKRRSRWLFAEDLEDALRSVRELRYRRAVVLLGTHHGVDTAVALVEAPAGAWAEDAVRALRVRADGVRIIVGIGPPGTIRRTTSGKVRRRTMWDAWVAGMSGVTVIAVAEAR